MDFNWPAALPPQQMIWSIQKAGVSFRSPYAGSAESVAFPGWFWKVSLTLKPRRARDGGVSEGFFNRMAGGVDAVLLYHWLRPVPRGTMRGAPTVGAVAARGDDAIVLATDGTLLAGDFFKVGGKVHQAFSDCAPVAGRLTVMLAGKMSKAAAIGDPVAWDHPTIRCVMPAMTHGSAYSPGMMAGAAVDLEEA